MVRLLAVVLEHNADRIAEVLLDYGVVHFMDVSHLKETWSRKLEPLNNGTFIPGIADVRKKIESLIRASGENPYSSDQEDSLHNALKAREKLELDKVEAFVDGLTNSLNRIRQQQRGVAGDIASLTEVLDQVKTYGIGFARGDDEESYSFIAIRIGELAALREDELRQALSQIPSVVIPMAEREQQLHLLIVSLRRHDQTIAPILDRLGWKEIELSTEVGEYKSDIVSDIEGRIVRLREEEEKLQTDAADILRKDLNELYHMWYRLLVYEKYYGIRTYFRKTARTVMFSGWLPEENRSKLMEALKSTTEGHCYMEWSKPDGSVSSDKSISRPPVQLRNPRFLAPFQMLVTGYTMPAYGTIDPTFFVVFAYLVMFGLMFADVGQGLVLLLAGICGSTLFKKQDGKARIQNLMKLIAWCGASAAVFGALFGSYFGFTLFPPLWFDYHSVVAGSVRGSSLVQDLFDILSIAVYFGIAIISIGLLFNWINLIRLREWSKLLLDKGGVVGGWIYGGGIYTALYLVRSGYRQLPDAKTLMMLIGIPALLLFLKEPILGISKGGKSKESTQNRSVFTPLNMIMVGIVELLEVFSGYLSNTLSFLRVAGLGIAHVSLMTAFLELARMAGSRGTGSFSIWSVLILIVGNMMVIGLEGLSAGIQSLRLHYYEFFTKFLQGSGDVYAPVSLRRVGEEK
jgi:V/A-type H+-transporting ATPase subunit I